MKENKFIKKAIYPGGNTALGKFIQSNLIYPSIALTKNIEGNVIVKFKINANGKVSEAKIVKGIGFGCDKEALRIVSKLQYAKVINRKIRVTTSTRINIKFKLPKKNKPIIINYEIVK